MSWKAIRTKRVINCRCLFVIGICTINIRHLSSIEAKKLAIVRENLHHKYSIWECHTDKERYRLNAQLSWESAQEISVIYLNQQLRKLREFLSQPQCYGRTYGQSKLQTTTSNIYMPHGRQTHRHLIL